MNKSPRNMLDSPETRSMLGINKDLVIVEQTYGKSGQLKTRYRCECGHIFSTTSKIPDYIFRSCGECPHNPKNSDRLRNIWKGMVKRCTNQNNPNYPNYGGRGITICQSWRKYANFQKWALSHGYNDTLTIDRINVNGNYSPKNCTWTSLAEQQKNRRNTYNNRYIEYNGKRLSYVEWASYLNIPTHEFARRVRCYGTDAACSNLTPKRNRHSPGQR